MKLQGTVVVGVLLALGAVALPTSAHAAPIETKVKIAGISYFPETETRSFTVKVNAKDPCKEGRSASVFEKVPGDDEKVGTSESNEFGIATVEDSPAPAFEAGQKFYAKVKGAKVGNKKCTAATSKTLTVT